MILDGAAVEPTTWCAERAPIRANVFAVRPRGAPSHRDYDQQEQACEHDARGGEPAATEALPQEDPTGERAEHHRGFAQH